MFSIRLGHLGGWCVLLGSLVVEAGVDFNREVRPILSGHCYRCHGPDEAKRQGGRGGAEGLRLDTFEGATAVHGGYAAVVAGDPGESELLHRVVSGEDEDRMPPPGAGRRLTEREVEVLRKWVEEGGNYAGHWAYEVPLRPEVPDVGEDRLRARNAIDAFVLRRLGVEGLRPSEQAEREVLARRVALDLTGLPPSREEVEAFVRDVQSDAFERYVDGQLSKEAYGEHWARQWLDLARYADSAGYADDPHRTIWAYRDYVIRSFNANKPFDEFTIEQLAGDMLPGATDEQVVATAFHRNTKTNNEGGTDDEEFRNEAIVDRVNTTFAVWMGTTIDCAQCHTHKYDPITQEEYFKVFAVFNQTADEDRGDEWPVLGLYEEEQKERMGALRVETLQVLNGIRGRLAEPAGMERRHGWERALLSGEGWRVLRFGLEDMEAESKAEMVLDGDGVIEVGEHSAPRDNYKLRLGVPEGGGVWTAVRLEVLGQENPWVLNELELHVKYREMEDGEEKEKSRRVKFRSATASDEQEWYEVRRAVDGNGGDRLSGWAVRGRERERQEAVLELEEPLELEAGWRLEFQMHQNFPHRKVRRFRISVTGDMNPRPAVPNRLQAGLAKRPEDRGLGEEAALVEFFAWHDPEGGEDGERLLELEQEMAGMRPRVTVPVMRELGEGRRRVTRVQYRGSFRDLGPEVVAGIPSVFGGVAGSGRVDRLGLARWLVSAENPLMARVVVNRYWEALFGVGLVATSEDFGSQGDLPSHPDLLDWLAVEFRESGWDVKHLLRLMVTSGTYRQSSKLSEELAERDPDNRLLARGPRVRLSAEMVRDQALAVSGLLSRKVGGASVRPPQPSMGLSAAFGSGTDWDASGGEDRYRRGVYTVWRRSSPYPSMAAFDAPSREVCTVRRKNTNTPLQALVTLNDPVYVEAAQALGRGLMQLDGEVGERVRVGLRECLVREPVEAEVRVLSELYEGACERFGGREDEARRLATEPLGDLGEGLGVVEAAAWTVVANAMLNLDEMFLKP
jgi:hypothetical protein